MYSSTELVRAEVPDSAVVERRVGGKEPKNKQPRLKFVDGETMSKAIAMAEARSRAKWVGSKAPVTSPKLPDSVRAPDQNLRRHP